MWGVKSLLLLLPLATFAAPVERSLEASLATHPAVQPLSDVNKNLVTITQEINAFDGQPSAMASIERLGYQVLTDMNKAATVIIAGEKFDVGDNFGFLSVIPPLVLNVYTFTKALRDHKDAFNANPDYSARVWSIMDAACRDLQQLLHGFDLKNNDAFRFVLQGLNKSVLEDFETTRDQFHAPSLPVQVPQPLGSAAQYPKSQPQYKPSYQPQYQSQPQSYQQQPQYIPQSQYQQQPQYQQLPQSQQQPQYQPSAPYNPQSPYQQQQSQSQYVPQQNESPFPQYSSTDQSF